MKIQQNGLFLPRGPVILFPGRLVAAIYREIILGAEEYKIAVLSELERTLEPRCIVAGFRNKFSDRFAYEQIGIDPGKYLLLILQGRYLLESEVL